MAERLKTWKDVARFFGVNTRTVMRWEAERGLPIHRLPGAARSHIYAEVPELQAWLNANPGEDEVQATLPRRRPWSWLWMGLAVPAAVAMAAAAVLWLPRPAHVPPAAARALYLKGAATWPARTPEALNAAIDDFNHAVSLDPAYAEAYAGLADCYNVMPEYTAMPQSQAYLLARTAAQKAVQLDDRLAAAHAALAFSQFYGFWQAADADHEFRRALALDPANATVHHWYGTYLASRGRSAESIAQLDKAMALDPASKSIRADRAIILFGAGQRGDAEAQLKAMAQADPQFRSPRTYLAQIYAAEGRDAEWLAVSRQLAAETNDLYQQHLIAAGEEGFRSGGHDGMLRAMLDFRLAQFRTGTGNALDIASLYAMLGDRGHTSAYLDLARQRHEGALIYLPVDRQFAMMKGDATYDGILKQVES